MKKIKEEIMSHSESIEFIDENGTVIKRPYHKKNKEKVKRWTREEGSLYENFIHMYSDIMKNSVSKRNSKIFLLMSKFIGKNFIF